MRENKKRRRKLILKLKMVVAGIISIITFIVIISAFIDTERSITVDKNMPETKKQNSTMQAEQIPLKHMIEIKGISQDGIPTGCEAVSTVTVLNYWGINISPEEFIGTYLKKESFYYIDDVLYGANPEEKFAGDPFDSSSLGCFPPVIVDAIEKMKECGYKGSEDIEKRIIKEKSFEDICKEYIINNIPVLVWVTIGMGEPKEGVSYYFEDGTRYTWTAGEHCMVLCGYDEDNYYFKDPLSEGRTVKYNKELAALRYEQMENRALAIFLN